MIQRKLMTVLGQMAVPQMYATMQMPAPVQPVQLGYQVEEHAQQPAHVDMGYGSNGSMMCSTANKSRRIGQAGEGQFAAMVPAQELQQQQHRQPMQQRMYQPIQQRFQGVR